MFLLICILDIFNIFDLLGRRLGRSPLIRRPPSGCRAFWTHCQTLASSCQTPKASCGHRPARRPPLQICAHSPRGRPKPPTMSITSRLFADGKIIKIPTPQKPSQNLKSRTHDCPNLGGSILALFFVKFLILS